ncbi:hypothetical protein P7L78_12170 [Tistrella bauzanensis]|uniref:Uncharacterized protein n=1 Tax=Tistrella arctica TaxID=3133430 RepID=A0ABU9YIJ7_9PROT
MQAPVTRTSAPGLSAARIAGRVHDHDIHVDITADLPRHAGKVRRQKAHGVTSIVASVRCAFRQYREMDDTAPILVSVSLARD